LSDIVIDWSSGHYWYYLFVNILLTYTALAVMHTHTVVIGQYLLVIVVLLLVIEIIIINNNIFYGAQTLISTSLSFQLTQYQYWLTHILIERQYFLLTHAKDPGHTLRMHAYHASISIIIILLIISHRNSIYQTVIGH
jgi:hypothetical protein